MSKPSTRQQLIDYSLRKLGFPVLEINVDDDQIDDLVDDALQYFQERHFDGVERVFLKHELTEANLNTLKTSNTTTSASSSVGVSNPQFTERNNFLQLPDHVLGVEKVFKMDQSTISSGLFNIKYQIFLNDLYYYGALDLMNYAMVKTYLEDLSRLITPDVQLRFNKRKHRLYMDIDWEQVSNDSFLIIDCHRLVDPANASDIPPMIGFNVLKDLSPPKIALAKPIVLSVAYCISEDNLFWKSLLFRSSLACSFSPDPNDPGF